MGGDKKEDNINVVLRVRPLIGIESVKGCRPIIKFPMKNQLLLGTDKVFSFDHVFPATVTQQAVYDATVRKQVDAYMGGYNATIFAYGQTGSGKTFTMGTASSKDVPSAQQGIVPRAVEHMFQVINKAPEHHEFTVRIAFLEIHNESLIDLLADPDSPESKTIPQIRENPDGEIFVTNCTEREVKSAAELLGFLESGSAQRTTGSTLMNTESSRSHAIFSIILDQVKYDVDAAKAEAQPTDELKSKFHFVDLAGSERLKRTGAVGQRMKEGISINGGLLALGNVISALADPARKKGGHVPFRDSKITRLLQDSLGGNSKTSMIACVSPADVNFEETLNTLKYANRAKNIKNQAVINRDPNAQKILALKNRVQELELALASAGGVVGPSGNGHTPSHARGLSSAGAILSSSAFEPSDDEINFLKEQSATYEQEIQRLTSSLKEARVQMSSLGDRLQTSETECDKQRIKLKHVADALRAMPNPPDVGMDLEVDGKELDAIVANRETIRSLEDEVGSLSMKLRTAKDEVVTLKAYMVEMEPSFNPGMDDADFDGLLQGPGWNENAVQKARDDSSVRQRRRHSMGDFTKFSSAMSMSAVGDLLVPSSLGEGDDDDDDDDDDVEPGGPGSALGQIGEEDDQEVRAFRTMAAVRKREHSFNMARLTQEHDKIGSDIIQKEKLMVQLLKTKETAKAMRRHYEQKIHDMETEIKTVQTDRETVLADLSDVRKSPDHSKYKAQAVKYEKRLHTLMDELRKVKEKLNENKRLQDARHKDEQRLGALKNEINFQRQEKVKLARKMKEEAEKHRLWMKQTNNKVKVLEKDARKSQLNIRNLKLKFEKQSAVLQRRNEEKSLLRNQLKESQRRAKGRKQMVATHRAGRANLARNRGNGTSKSRLAPAVAPTHEIEKLKEGFEKEIRLAVNRLKLVSEEQRLVEQRDEAQTQFEKAEAIVMGKEEVDEEEKAYWQDRYEGLQSQIQYINTQVVNCKVELSHLRQSTEENQGNGAEGGLTKKSIFSRHRVTRLDQGRSLILYLVDQVVQLKRAQHEYDQEVESLRLKYSEAKYELKQVTRQSLVLRRSTSAKEMLAEMDSSSVKSGDGTGNSTSNGADSALHTPTQPPNRVAHFLRSLNLESSPDAAASKGGGKGGSNKATDGNGGANGKRRSRQSKNNIWNRLHESHTESSKLTLEKGDHSPNGTWDSSAGHSADAGSGGPGTAPTSANSDAKEGKRHRRSRSQMPSNETKDEHLQVVSGRTKRGASVSTESRGSSVFDRLTDSRQFTGMYKAIHKKKPKANAQVKVTRPESAPPASSSGGGGSADKSRDKNVFSRLTDQSSYTGMYKNQHKDAKKATRKEEEDARLRSLSAMENELDAMAESWKSSSVVPATRNNNIDEHDEEEENQQQQQQQQQHSTPTRANPLNPHLTPVTPSTVASPIDKGTAKNAVKKLDSLFNRFWKSKGKAGGDGENADANKIVPSIKVGNAPKQYSEEEHRSRLEAQLGGETTETSTVSNEQMRSPPPKAQDVLAALTFIDDDDEEEDNQK